MATIALIGVAVTLLAAGASAYAQHEQAEAQSKVLKYNAREAERQAEVERNKAQFQANQQAEADRRTRAAARAIQGTSGVAVGEGSSLLVDIDSARQAELNYQAIRFAGAERGRALSAQATIDRFQASNIRQQGNLGAGATLLGGAASSYGVYQRSTAAPKTIQVPTTGMADYYMVEPRPDQ